MAFYQEDLWRPLFAEYTVEQLEYMLAIALKHALQSGHEVAQEAVVFWADLLEEKRRGDG